MITLFIIYMYILWWFLHGAVLLKIQQLALNTFYLIGEISIVQLHQFVLDPFEQVTAHLGVILFQAVSFHHLTDNLITSVFVVSFKFQLESENIF